MSHQYVYSFRIKSGKKTKIQKKIERCTQYSNESTKKIEKLY